MMVEIIINGPRFPAGFRRRWPQRLDHFQHGRFTGWHAVENM